MRGLVIVLWLITSISNAQSFVSFRIADSATGSPVPFALVIDETGKKGIISDENGIFKTLLSDSSHSFLATSIGYDTTRFRGEINRGSIIYLSKRFFLLDTVAIYGTVSTQIKSLGAGKKRPLFARGFAYSIGGEVAVFMPNECKSTGVIQKIRFYIGKNGYPTTKFRAKLYYADTLIGGPSDLLVQSDILLSAEKGNEWVESDISYLNISIPKNGFYVAMEWLPDSRSYKITPKEGMANGQLLGAVKTSIKSCTTWVKSLDSGWLKFSSFFAEDGACQNAMIGADVLIQQ